VAPACEKLGVEVLMARSRRKGRKPIAKPRLTNDDIDHCFAVAAETVKEIERQLQSTLKLPASSLLLRIQTRR
jgi:hypothetical protein